MIRMINAITGSTMWVHESRVEEYLAAGHKLAAPPPPPPKAAKPAKKKSPKKE